jgi:hypothetical protein
MWLPYRRAKNPAGMLLAAVKDDYEAPPLMRRQEQGASYAEPASPAADLNQGEEIDLTMPS